MATAFNTQGATPTQTPMLPGLGGAGYTPSTSAAKALHTALSPSSAPSYKAPMIPAAAPAPANQPIKKQTVTTASGDTHMTEYHPPMQAGVLQQPEKAPPTFPGILGSLTGASQQGSPVAGTAAKQLVNTQAGTPTAQRYTAQTAAAGTGNEAIGQAAKDIAAQYGQEYANVGRKGANAESGYLTTGTSPVAEGNAGVIARNTAAQQSAIAAGEEAALQGTGQQLTAQQQEANALNAAAGTALTGQSNQIAAQNEAGQLGIAGQGQLQSGLTSAATLAQPQLGAIGQVPFSPLSQEQGAILGTTQTGGIGAAGNLLGQFEGAKAVGAAGGTAAAHNIGTAGTATTDANNKIYQDATNASAGFKTAQNNINNLGNSILQFMSTNPGINNLGARALNMQLNNLQTQLNDPQYSQFNSQIAGLQRAVSQYIQAGEIPTASTAAAKSIADGSISLGALAGALQGINADLDAAAKAQDTTATYAKQQMQSGANASPASGGSSAGSIVRTTAGTINTNW